MKKFLAIVLTVAMMLSLVSLASAEGFSGEIKIWVADAVVDFTKEQVEAFKAANPEYADMTVTVEPVGEGDAATSMIQDVEAGADIYGFAQDQLGRLVVAGAIIDLDPDIAETVKVENDAGSVGAIGTVEGDWLLIGFGDLLEDAFVDISESGETGALSAGRDGAFVDFDLPIVAGSWGFAIEGIDVTGVSHIDIDFDAELFDELFAFGSDVFGVGSAGLVEFAAAVVKTLFDVAAFD